MKKVSIKKITLAVTLGVFFAIMQGCGYHFKSHRIGIPQTDYFRSIIVNNATFEPELKLLLKDDLTTLFTKNGWLVRGGATESGSVFRCTVKDFRSVAASYVGSDDITRYSAVLTFDISVEKGASKELLYKLDGKEYSELYIVSRDIKITQRNKREAIKKISGKFIDDIEDIISEGF